MNEFIELNRLLREITTKALDGHLANDAGEGFAVVVFTGYLRRDIEQLESLWPPTVSRDSINEMTELLQSDNPAFYTLAELALKAGDMLDGHFRMVRVAASDRNVALVELLEPAIVRSSLRQFQQGLYRDAVFNAFVAIFDLLRERTGIDDDGSSLVSRAFSLERPILIVAELSTTSGQNEQKGFIQLLQGIYLGIRNPRAHTLAHDLDERTTRQYLIMASLLARRIQEAQLQRAPA